MAVNYTDFQTLQTANIADAAITKPKLSLDLANELDNKQFDYTQIVHVTSKLDLPESVGGVITLPSENKNYYFLEIVDLQGDTINIGNNILTGISQEVSGIANATVNINQTCTIRYFRFDNVAMIINAPTGAFDWTYVNFYNSPNCVDIVAADNIVFGTFGFINSYNFKLSGTINSLILSQNNIFRSIVDPNAVMFDITPTAVVNRRIRIQDSVFATDFTQIGLRFQTGAVIPDESLILIGVRFTGTGTYTSGINGDNLKAFFENVVGQFNSIINSTAIANMYMKNNTTPTVITTAGERYAVLGTTELGVQTQRFVHIPSENSLQYVSSVSRTFRVQATFTQTSGNNNVIGNYFAVNRVGTPINPTNDRISESEIYITTSGTRPDSGAIQAFVRLNEGDKVYVITQNTTNVQPVTFVFLQVIVERTN